MKEGIICGIISMIGALVGCFAALAVYNIWPEWASIMAGMVAALAVIWTLEAGHRMRRAARRWIEAVLRFEEEYDVLSH